LVTLESLQQPGVIRVERMDTGVEVPVSVSAELLENNAATHFRLNFARDSGVTYQGRIDCAPNLRGGGQWAPFSQRLVQAQAEAIQPEIHRIEGGAYHRGAQGDITIHGAGFRNAAEVQLFVDRYPVSYRWQDEQTLVIPAQALAMLP